MNIRELYSMHSNESEPKWEGNSKERGYVYISAS